MGKKSKFMKPWMEIVIGCVILIWGISVIIYRMQTDGDFIGLISFPVFLIIGGIAYLIKGMIHQAESNIVIDEIRVPLLKLEDLNNAIGLPAYSIESNKHLGKIKSVNVGERICTIKNLGEEIEKKVNDISILYIGERKEIFPEEFNCKHCETKIELSNALIIDNLLCCPNCKKANTDSVNLISIAIEAE
ncbi:MAG: hypothetical protein PVH88_14695 [Ignavibacteria bacterium]